VFDVSRWGRFQDPDEAAHYEFVCREAGVRIAYTAEPFADDGSLIGALVKQMKRAMAAEYSRELSNKIALAKRGLSLEGYWPGGNPGLGLRRCPVDSAGRRYPPLDVGERNAVKGRRMVVVAGPPEEVATVRRIFALCVDTRLNCMGIARRMNAEGSRAAGGRPWTQMRVRRILANELYTGVRVVGRAQVRLGVFRRKPEAEWVRVADGGEAIIPAARFRTAQRRIPRRRRLSDAELDAALQDLLARRGRLSNNVIQADPLTATPGVYRARFGSLTAAYARIGYEPSPEQLALTAQLAPVRHGGRHPALSPLTDAEVIARLQALRLKLGLLDIETIEVTPGLPRVRNLLRRFGSMARVYELAGHEPPLRQRQGLARRGPKGADRPRAALVSEPPPPH
ncbi:MAG: recombinase family protein, partial [Phenylobacterium sp.]|nr:recombinase family protein [Phenylobacterium sp.]